MSEECPDCKMRVKLTKVEEYPDYKVRFYSCGHISKLIQKSINETPVKVQNGVSASKRVERSIIEPAIIVSDSIANFKQSAHLAIEEKTYDGRPSLQFTGGNASIVITNSTVIFSSPEGKTSQNISSTSIWEKIQSLSQQVKEDTSIINKDKFLSLLEKIESLNEQQEKKVSIWTRLNYRFAGKKWVFPITTPYILKIIDILGDFYSKDNK